MPKRYPIRHYPDITHSRQSQYPVPDWDVAYAVTEGREAINPRPLDEATIFTVCQPYTIGFLTYSEGCNDDVNKIVWSGLGWNPDAQRRRYPARIQPLFHRRRNTRTISRRACWRWSGTGAGRLATNAGVETTLAAVPGRWSAPHRPALRANWRFQQALYRAYYDAYIACPPDYMRPTVERQRWPSCKNARALGSLARHEARAKTISIVTWMASRRLDLRARVFELAEALFQSIRMQLSVPRYKAISMDRGANLDTIDVPLNNRGWLQQKFAEIRQQPDEADRLAGSGSDRRLGQIPVPVDSMTIWGIASHQPHLVRGTRIRRPIRPFSNLP